MDQVNEDGTYWTAFMPDQPSDTGKFLDKESAFEAAQKLFSNDMDAITEGTQYQSGQKEDRIVHLRKHDHEGDVIGMEKTVVTWVRKVMQ